MNGHKEEIDAIMEEMEANTPKSGERTKTFEAFTETVTEKTVTVGYSDVTDAKGIAEPNKKSFFSITQLFTRDLQKPGLKHPSRPTDEKYYDFTNPNVGMALIFNQVRVKNEPERKGSQKDADDLKEVLSEKGFEVQVFNDFTGEQIRKTLLKGKC